MSKSLEQSELFLFDFADIGFYLRFAGIVWRQMYF